MRRLESRRGRRWVPALVACLAAHLTAAGCDGGREAGPIGERIAPGRDFDNLFFWQPSDLAFTRVTTTPGATEQDLWVWSDAEVAPVLALSEVELTPALFRSRIVIGDILMTGPHGSRIYDLDARAAADLTTVAAAGGVGAAPVDYAAIRRDGASVIAYRSADATLLAGRGSGFTAVTPLVVKAVDFLGDDLVVLGSQGNDSLASDAVLRVALPSGDVAPVPVPAFDGASSAANLSAPRCAAFTTSPCGLFRVLGCRDDVAACPETGRPPCWLLYQRSDGTDLHPYAFDLDSGQELALPGDNPSSFSLSPDQHRVAWTHSDLDDQANGSLGSDQSNVYFHDFCTGAAGSCPMPHPEALVWRADGDLLMMVLRYGLAMAQLPAGTCGDPGTLGQVKTFAFSPTGDRLVGFQLAGFDDEPAAGVLFTSDADGQQARVLLQGSIRSFAFSPDGQGLFITHVLGDQLSLRWLSLTDDNQAERVLGAVYSGMLSRGDQRALFIDEWNGQDLSGTLALVDLMTGERTVLARAVTNFAANASVDGDARVDYTVRGRYASAQDGLWRITLPTP
jgi:hypothetical protein